MKNARTVVCLNAEHPSPYEDRTEIWRKLRDVNNYKVGVGDNFDATEHAFLRIVEVVDQKYPFNAIVTTSLARKFERFVRNLVGSFPFVVGTIDPVGVHTEVSS